MEKFNTGKAEILFVNVPDEFCYYPSTFSISQSEPLELALCDVNGEGKGAITLPYGNWQLIGLTSEVTEDQAKMMVDKHYSGLGYDDYFSEVDFALFENALDSFKYLMQHKKLYEVNPYEKPEYVFDYYGKSPEEFKRFESDMLNYTEAQERTSKRVVLFKPNEK